MSPGSPGALVVVVVVGVPPAVANPVVDFRPGWEKYASRVPVTSSSLPTRLGLDASPYAERNVEVICT